ncbi:hypothetical protein DSL64_01785 [Dyadobacter luteus]|jgi:hypothetical protein|uniref:DUF1572 domain-containing protein n=1 Tax=Dyadobacter luteus TaxID=2259619 RepID=A0A3D8YHL5_9BACT|nr:DUF1572 family protein [Dyadobacter luteus]REA64304.1 hypothetical protein DSL64_01785 [Dyadobacter luteus]
MSSYLTSVIKQFEYYKMLGEKSFAQLPDEGLFLQFGEDNNSIAIIVRHLSGNMLSRFTDFLTTDGEKPWRNRDEEFEPWTGSREDLYGLWNKGWNCLLTTLAGLQETDLEKIVYIRNEGHTVTEAINRQLAHYAYHVGQIVFAAKLIRGQDWQSLSIPRNGSGLYNEKKFNTDQSVRHFTDEWLEKGVKDE